MLPGATDRLFLHFCRTGSARSLGKVFDRTAPELLRVALYLSGDRSDADDLVQRTFLAAIESRGSYDPRRRAMPWLLGILANHARRLQRERALRRAAVVPQPVAGDDPAIAASNRELAERITRLRSELGAPYAEVLALHLEQGLNAKEIAQRLGRPAGTVRTQLVRALDRMRKHLPSGFVGAWMPPLSGLSELLAIKGSVLAANHALLPAGSSAVTIATGGLLMSKKLIVASAGLLLLAAGLYTTWPSGDAATAMSTASTDSRPTGLPSPVLQGTVAAAEDDVGASSRQPDTTVAADVDPGFGSLRVVVLWEDGRPAEGVGVRAEGMEAARNERRILVTAGDGTCLVPHLRPALWLITITHADRSFRIEVQAGAQQSCRFTAKSVATVRGRVVDEQQRPVAGADICIATGQCEYTVGLSGHDGGFVLPLPMEVQVGARKVGFMPSLVLAVDPGQPREDIVLALRGNAGCIQGTVRDAQGQPVAWARVLNGMQQMMPSSFNGPYERQWYVPGGIETSTDREGRFTVNGVEPGKHFVRAWSPGHAVAQVFVEVTAGVSSCNLILLAGGVVEGTVRDAAGEPVGNAVVGPAIDQDRFVEVSARTGADGRYRLVDLSPGQCSLWASSEAARASSTIAVTAGATAEWNPVLRRVTDIRGRLLDADDRPLAGVAIGIVDGNFAALGPATVTDQAGAFVLQPQEERPVDLRVGDPTLKHVRRVRPGVQDLVIRLTAADLPSAWLRGRVVDQSASPIRATVSAWLAGESEIRSAETAADGRFQIGPLSPGRYTVRVVTPAHGSRPLSEVVLVPQGERDFGDVVMQTPGSATVDVRDQQGNLTKSFVILYDTDAGWVASMRTDQGRATFPALQPGRYFITCGGAPLAARGEFEVPPAGRAHADVQLAQVGHADVLVHDPAKAADLALSAIAFNGGRFAGLFSNRRGAANVRVWLPPGSYTVEVRAPDGRSVRCEVSISSLDDHPEVKVELPAK